MIRINIFKMIHFKTSSRYFPKGLKFDSTVTCVTLIHRGK